MTSLWKRKTFNYILRVGGRENDTGLVVKKNYYEDEPFRTKCYTDGLGQFTECMEKERVIMKVKTKERENV